MADNKREGVLIGPLALDPLTSPVEFSAKPRGSVTVQRECIVQYKSKITKMVIAMIRSKDKSIE